MRDAACPISTGSGTRRVHLVREGGGADERGRGADALLESLAGAMRDAAPEVRTAAAQVRAGPCLRPERLSLFVSFFFSLFLSPSFSLLLSLSFFLSLSSPRCPATPFLLNTKRLELRPVPGAMNRNVSRQHRTVGAGRRASGGRAEPRGKTRALARQTKQRFASASKNTRARQTTREQLPPLSRLPAGPRGAARVSD